VPKISGKKNTHSLKEKMGASFRTKLQKQLAYEIKSKQINSMGSEEIQKGL